jgi:hypothetical protein
MESTTMPSPMTGLVSLEVKGIHQHPSEYEIRQKWLREAAVLAPERRGASMPRFFFDIQDGDIFAEDLEGLELTNLDEADAQAAQALVDLAKERLSEEGTLVLVATMRDGSRRTVSTTTLSVTSTLTRTTSQ